MTISTTTSRVSYNGNGVTTVFAVPFRFFQNSDLVVQLVTVSTGATSTLALTTHYTVTGADEEAGGSLTMLTAPAVGQTLVIRRVITATQEVDYISGEPFPAETHERALDRLTMLAQQSEEQQGRNLTLPATDSANAELPPVALRANRLVGFNSTGDLVVTAPSSGSAEELALALADPEQGAEMVAFSRPETGAAARTVEARLADTLHDSDFSDTSSLLAAASTGKTILVLNPAAAPAASVGANLLWNFTDGGDSRNVLNTEGARGGYFADYDCKAKQILVGQFMENQSAIPGGGFRETLFISAVDNDTTNYTAIGQKITGAIRGIVQGAYNTPGGVYVPQYKDLHGAYFAAIGDIRWNSRGCSGVLAEAIQYGSGIASNEFAATQPADAPLQSTSMAAVQAIIDARRTDENSPSHIYRGVYISNRGRRATFGLQMLSDGTFGYSGHFAVALGMGDAAVTNAAIVMPQSAVGGAGCIIQYDTNDYSTYYRGTNQFVWVVGGDIKLVTTNNGISVGTSNNINNSRVFIEASTTSVSHMQMFPGSTPSAPNNGEIWFDGTALRMQIGGATRTFTVT